MPTKNEREVQETAELIYKWLQQLRSPRDGAVCIALVQTALIWTQRPADEAEVRKVMADTTEAVVVMWKAQVEDRAKEVVNAQMQKQ